MLARAMPWRHVKEDEADRRVLKEAADDTAEQEALAPVIDAQSDFLTERGAINGFTRQLRAGFERKLAGE